MNKINKIKNYALSVDDKRALENFSFPKKQESLHFHQYIVSRVEKDFFISDTTCKKGERVARVRKGDKICKYCGKITN